METTATVKLVLDSREKEESRKQLKIRVTFERIPRLYSTETKVLLTKEELENPKLKAHKHAMEKVKRSLSIANEIVLELGESLPLMRLAESTSNDYMQGQMISPCLRWLRIGILKVRNCNLKR